jgi:photosystem II stability/assembly factor-like uncharacterized protein
LLPTPHGGAKWSKLRTPKGAIARVDFTSAKAGFLLQRSGRLFKTGSGGRKWTEVLTLGTGSSTGISFADSKRGFAIGSRTLRTNDGGASWQPVDLDGGRTTLKEVAASGAGTALGVTSSGFAFARRPAASSARRPHSP